MDPQRVTTTVREALARQLGLSPAAVAEADTTSLDELGLDSHGLMRVLLAVEDTLALERELDLPDEALDTPQSLCDGVRAAVG